MWLVCGDGRVHHARRVPDEPTSAACTARASAIASAVRLCEYAPRVQRVRSVLQAVPHRPSRLRRLRQRRVPSFATTSAMCKFHLQRHSRS